MWKLPFDKIHPRPWKYLFHDKEVSVKNESPALMTPWVRRFMRSWLSLGFATQTWRTDPINPLFRIELFPFISISHGCCAPPWFVANEQKQFRNLVSFDFSHLLVARWYWREAFGPIDAIHGQPARKWYYEFRRSATADGISDQIQWIIKRIAQRNHLVALLEDQLCVLMAE